MMESGSKLKSEGKHDYREATLETIKTILLEIFGQDQFLNMIKVMEDSYSLNWEEIPEKPGVFSEALKGLLGKGSMIIEDLIVENLYISYGLEFEYKKTYSFNDYLFELKKYS